MLAQMKTDPSLAARQSLRTWLRDWEDRLSWPDFFETYWPLIYSAAIHAGLTDAEAQEVVRETVFCIAASLGGFSAETGCGSFKSWLLTTTRRRIRKQFNNRQVQPQRAGACVLDCGAPKFFERSPDPADVDLDAVWDQEWERTLYAAAVQQVKSHVSPSQFRLYDLRVTQAWPAEDVSRTLGVSVGAVHLAEHRLSRLIDKELRRLERGDL